MNAAQVIGLAGQQITVGVPLAGQRVTLRLDGSLMQVIADGMLVRTLPCPIPPQRRAYISDAQLSPLPPTAPQDAVRVGRKVSARGSIQVCGQRVQVGMAHARTVVTVEVTDTTLHVLDHDGNRLRTVPRTTRKEVTRYKAYGTARRPDGTTGGVSRLRLCSISQSGCDGRAARPRWRSASRRSSTAIHRRVRSRSRSCTRTRKRSSTSLDRPWTSMDEHPIDTTTETGHDLAA